MNCLSDPGRCARGLRCVLPLLVLLIGLAGCTSNMVRVASTPGVTRFWVTLRLRPQLQMPAAITDDAARPQFVMDELRRTAAASQGPVISFLQQRHAKFEPFWVANIIWVEADEETRKQLAGLPEVESIEADQAIALNDPTKPMAATPIAALTVEESVRRLHAPEVWDRGITGEGVVVGIIDSGFVPHPAITDKYRGYQSNGTFSNLHNWADFTSLDKGCDSPCDRHGHGTHVTGTVVGRAGEDAIGVAPGAKFIACRALDDQGLGSVRSVIDCLQWFAQPGQRPNIINMSFEGVVGGSALGAAISNLQAAGILSVAASATFPGTCGTVVYPGALPNVLTVGALTANPEANWVTPYTSTGFGKPDLMAQGDAVRSSWLNNNYRVMSGTSMAAPAVSGVAALVMSADPRLLNDPVGVMELLKATSNRDVIPSPRGNCPGAGGYGLVDAEAAIVQALR